MEYGVNVTNKFKFLSDDETEDPFEAIAKAEAAKKAQPVQKKDKKAAAVAKPVAPVKAEPEKPQRQANKENAPPRGGRGGGRGRVNFAERKDAGNRDENKDVMGDRFGERPVGPGVGRGFGGRGSGRGFRGGDRGRGGFRSDRPRDEAGFRSGGETEEENRGPRGGQGFRRGPRRGYALRGDRHHPGGDRHSGSDRTGVRPQPKKEGFGKGNWGTENDELAGETEQILPPSDTEVAQKPEERVEGEGAESGQDEKKEEEEEKTKELTLAEWKALHGQQQEKPAFQPRKAGEGQDKKIYDKLVPLKKEEEPEEHEEVIIVRREPREKPLNIEVSFSDANRDRRDRSDRGFRGGRGGDRDDFRGGRGGGGDRRGGGDFRGPPRSGRRGGNNFALNDEAFPALGGK